MIYKNLRIAGFGVAICLVAALFTLGAKLYASRHPIHAQDLPQPSFDARYFTDRHDKSLGIILSQDQEHTLRVKLSDVSPFFVQGIISAEDQRFYQHDGVDYRALLRAAWQQAVFSKRRSGASTITMQLARMLNPKPRTLASKLHEIFSAWRMEAGMTKGEILIAYINRLPMGGNLYGIEAASRHYFGIRARELDLAQASLLAAIPKDPNGLQPHKYFTALRTRQSYVLDRLYENAAIDSAARRQAWQEKLSLKDPAQILFAPHLLVRLNKAPSSDYLLKTTIDFALQRFVEEQTRHTLRNLKGVQHAAALVVDNKTGEVLAYVGSPDYYEPRAGMNDGVQAKRQTGSAIKPFLYEYAFEQNLIQPTSILADIPSQWDLGEKPGQYAPQNYNNDFLGPVRASAALANSLNVPAVRVLQQMSIVSLQARLQTLGITLPHDADYYGLGLILGDAEVSLAELTRAYLTFARSGNSLPLKFLLNTSSADNSALQNVGDAQVWQLTAQLLADPYLRAHSFGVDSILRLPFPVAVKTGTSSNYRDNWTLGFSADYTVGVWVGNFDGTSMKNISGVTGAAPLFAKIMLRLHEDHPPAAFPLPEKFVKVQVCPLSGKAPGKHCPHIALDFIAKEKLAKFSSEPCDWHRPHGEVLLPALYHEWGLQHKVTITQSGLLRILHPVEGSRYILSSTIPYAQQKLELKVSGVHEDLHWLLDGQHLSGTGDHLLWPLLAGKHRLQVYAEDGQHAEVGFEVAGDVTAREEANPSAISKEDSLATPPLVLFSSARHEIGLSP